MFVRFLFFPSFLYCILWNEVPIHSHTCGVGCCTPSLWENSSNINYFDIICMGVLVCSPPSNYLYQYGVTDLYFMIWATILHGLIDFVTHIFPALAIVNIYLCLCPFDIAPRCWVCFLFICCCWDFFFNTSLLSGASRCCSPRCSHFFKNLGSYWRMAFWNQHMGIRQ